MCAAITSASISAVTSGYSIYQGAKQKKEAEKALNEFDRQELENVYADLPVSTVGSDFMAEQNSRTTAQLIGASQKSGSRGVFSSIPKIQAMSNDSNREGRAYLDNQVQQNNRLVAQDNVRIQGVQEQRDNAELAGIGQQMEVGQAYLDQGIRGLGNAAISGARNIDFTGDGSYNQEQGLTPDGLPRNGESSNSNYNQRYARRSLNRSVGLDSSMDGGLNYMSDLPKPLGMQNTLYTDYQPKPYGLG